MRKLTSCEIITISGGRKIKVLNIVGGAIFGGVYNGVATTLAYEAAMGLTEVTHPQYGIDN